MTARKKAHKEQDFKATYEHEQSEDGKDRLQKIFEFLLSDESKAGKDARGSR